MLNLDRRSRKRSWLACAGGLLAATAIGLSAYASHGVSEPLAQSHLQTAALYAFGHGLALAALARSSERLLARAALALLLLGTLLGTLLFSGSLAGNALAQWPTRLAPVGGTTLMLGWLLYALDALRR
ncbi:hypothetical protein A6R71_10055 [Xanthomonas translucens pv. arrhenatheri]|uniref:DUF423 domain-containing protein n=1 Tax=Xanthomonas graminis pv. arrhenatheri LMG 727 TaxID=1195923 RepID=A0A0K2ZVE9_9XANT|nr:DUF423 domain-containing protein [Xanthomonas translucens]OAX64916.1 hypothetical protein A6R71_10055 [Xanthomonas translucens pv. arrhenatheri]UKE78646.1 DUF423 domain-containing protein [Xanthomonas translucens pv. arrhenatheri]CTP88134.1 hypothetical protein XTALMG727_2273 [Xanthomonas translucens pv. arrhenatheri LMG 727]